jgi:hypothetical protein
LPAELESKDCISGCCCFAEQSFEVVYCLFCRLGLLAFQLSQHRLTLRQFLTQQLGFSALQFVELPDAGHLFLDVVQLVLVHLALQGLLLQPVVLPPDLVAQGAPLVLPKPPSVPVLPDGSSLEASLDEEPLDLSIDVFEFFLSH